MKIQSFINCVDNGSQNRRKKEKENKEEKIKE